MVRWGINPNLNPKTGSRQLLKYQQPFLFFNSGRRMTIKNFIYPIGFIDCF